ncbi:acyl-ACP--UDP-N-acetylglucosamine O-acyltransferase [Ketobacter sp. MCCC 1A13808]|uniref:acyl-ACP--UDP-N-acetylglucosamine O-acyltransferase n=1 Tax=Ketobacter sp. MCCC 1A13808 TaxID=2602738 RepID=UPI0012EC9D8F|nr:acyl-ACP--UDP-N-acetylglucosamine O-acyltransferase [Ketobacter sp. MCCC 1A13808]MVF12742.1 acyl-ACP--UDP-N-acetylglucosamine O-acyltransferase [Ketobacter sp. MCCC 1A13808]
MIHPQAVVDPKANLASDVEVGPFTYIGPGVEIGAGTVVHSHVCIKGPTKIGKRNRIFQFASVGEDCQDKKYKGEPTTLEIGDDNQIRESCTIHRGTIQDEGITQIGSGNLFMAYTHVAHDCRIGDNNIFANNASVAGHVHVAHDVILAGFAGVHQFCRIGAYSMLGLGTLTGKDVPAFVMAIGNPAKPSGMNFEGMRRRGFPKESIRVLREAYKTVYMRGQRLEQAILQLEALPHDDLLQLFIESIKSSERGIVR